ncbi:nucleolin 2-like [Papaver somniferum]|uniref:nucleolin 2-like n=1 Tax=Papaver somniferum TaxID=3469 RepID=UPI000E6F7326|nr:nucleolin 2-like [Papaver somniferum]
MHVRVIYSVKFSTTIAAAASPIVGSGNKRDNKRDAGEEIEIKLKKKKVVADFSKMKTIQEFSNGNSSSNDQTTPSAPQLQSTKASKTVTARNIPFSIHKSDLIEFFKQAGEVVDAWYWKRSLEIKDDTKLEIYHQKLSTKSDVIEYFKWAGEIIDVRFSSLDNENFSGYCHIEFATEEGAKRAAKLNGQHCLGRPFELRFARETICVRGFDTSIKFDQIHSSLEEIFSTCGKIIWMHIPTFPYTNVTLGKAFIELYDLRAFPKALAMNGHKLGDSTLRVEDATPLQLDVNPPGRRRRIGGRPVGPYGGSIYPRRYFPHRGWGGAGIGKHKGILHKIIFDDDSPGGRTVDWGSPEEEK